MEGNLETERQMQGDGKSHIAWSWSSLWSWEKKELSAFSVPASLAFTMPLWVPDCFSEVVEACGLLAHRKLLPPVRLPYISYELWCLGLFSHQLLKQVFLSSSLDTVHCKMWGSVIYYWHLPLQGVDQFPFLQMVLTGQQKKGLLAICFLLPFQAG